MSPSKKANNRTSRKSTKGTQGSREKKNSARSSRVTERTGETPRQNKTQPKGRSRKERSDQINIVPSAQEQSPTQKPKAPLLTNLLRVISLLAVIGITIYIYNIREHVAEFEKFGYVGIFVIALLANATVLLPAPGVAIIYAMGAVFNPFGVGLAAGTGGAIGELSGYLAGFSGQAVIERTDIYERFKPWVDKYGGWAILALSAIPNPFFDVAGIAAGISKMPMRTFLFFTWCGQLIKMTLFALAGRYSIEWIAKFIG